MRHLVLGLAATIFVIAPYAFAQVGTGSGVTPRDAAADPGFSTSTATSTPLTATSSPAVSAPALPRAATPAPAILPVITVPAEPVATTSATDPGSSVPPVAPSDNNVNSLAAILGAAVLAVGSGALAYAKLRKTGPKKESKEDGPRCLNLKKFMEEKLRELTDLKAQAEGLAKEKAGELLGVALRGTPAGEMLFKIEQGKKEYDRLKELYEQCMAGAGSGAVTLTYFVHGTTSDNEAGISSGWSDAGLSDLGRKQSLELKEQIKDKKFDVVFCSDLRRAMDSTKLMFEEGVKIVPDARLRECNYGEYNGKPSNIVEPLYEGSTSARLPGGESYEDVKARVAEFLEFVKKEYAGKNVAIVAHKAPQLALDVLLNKKSWDQALSEDWRKKKLWRPGWQYVVE